MHTTQVQSKIKSELQQAAVPNWQWDNTEKAADAVNRGMVTIRFLCNKGNVQLGSLGFMEGRDSWKYCGRDCFYFGYNPPVEKRLYPCWIDLVSDFAHYKKQIDAGKVQKKRTPKHSLRQSVSEEILIHSEYHYHWEYIQQQYDATHTKTLVVNTVWFGST